MDNSWTASVRGEIVGRSADLPSARRACLNDMGRTRANGMTGAAAELDGIGGCVPGGAGAGQ
jgi:hypothetical protein